MHTKEAEGDIILDDATTPDTLTAHDVFSQIIRSVRTLRKLPPVAVKSRFCNWPEVIRSFHEAYGYTEAAMPRLVPTARQLSELDAVIRWIAWLSRFGEEYPRIIWARAENRSWRNIATIAGIPKDTCAWRFREGIYALTIAINENKLK